MGKERKGAPNTESSIKNGPLKTRELLFSYLFYIQSVSLKPTGQSIRV